MASTEASVNVSVNGEVEFVVGEKTKAWLVSLGWTPPVETDEMDGSAEMVEEAPVLPSKGKQAALVALNSREAERGKAQARYLQLLSEIEPPNDRLLALLEYFGVNMEKFLAPVREVEIPGMAADASSGA